MSKVTTSAIKDADYKWVIFCPGCEMAHAIDESWTFNGDLDNPTFHPSVQGHKEGVTCHSIIADGNIQFLDVCTHDLNGQTVELPEEVKINPNTGEIHYGSMELLSEMEAGAGVAFISIPMERFTGTSKELAKLSNTPQRKAWAKRERKRQKRIAEARR